MFPSHDHTGQRSNKKSIEGVDWLSLHTYTERLGFSSDIDCLKHYYDLEDVLVLLLDVQPNLIDDIHELIVDAVYDDKNVDDELKVIEWKYVNFVMKKQRTWVDFTPVYCVKTMMEWKKNESKMWRERM